LHRRYRAKNVSIHSIFHSFVVFPVINQGFRVVAAFALSPAVRTPICARCMGFRIDADGAKAGPSW
jgi:hypothetical protein